MLLFLFHNLRWWRKQMHGLQVWGWKGVREIKPMTYIDIPHMKQNLPSGFVVGSPHLSMWFAILATKHGQHGEHDLSNQAKPKRKHKYKQRIQSIQVLQSKGKQQITWTSYYMVDLLDKSVFITTFVLVCVIALMSMIFFIIIIIVIIIIVFSIHSPCPQLSSSPRPGHLQPWKKYWNIAQASPPHNPSGNHHLESSNSRESE